MIREHILITGATGDLGSAVLAQAAEEWPQARWTALVRAEDEAHARQRLFARLVRYTDAATARRLVADLRILVGDVFSLGQVPPGDLDDITHILHLAADTSYWSRTNNWRVNFDGTMAVADAATRMPLLQRMLHVGTATICGRNAPALVEEARYPHADAEHIVYYTHAKAETETALAERYPNLPVVIARPSIVAGHSKLGSRPSASIFWFVRCAEALGLVTCSPQGGIDIIPSDWAASAMMHLLLKPTLDHKVYHVSAGTGARCRWPELMQAFADVRGDGIVTQLQQIGPNDTAVLRDRFRAAFGKGDPRVALMMKAARKYFEFCALDATFDNSRLLAEGMPMPPSLPEYLGVCLREPAGRSILDAFLDDAGMFDPTTAPAAEPLSITPEPLPIAA